MALIEMYKNLSLIVDYHLKIINYLKIKNSKPLTKHFYTVIIGLVNNYYNFTQLTLDAKTIL